MSSTNATRRRPKHEREGRIARPRCTVRRRAIAFEVAEEQAEFQALLEELADLSDEINGYYDDGFMLQPEQPPERLVVDWQQLFDELALRRRVEQFVTVGAP